MVYYIALSWEASVACVYYPASQIPAYIRNLILSSPPRGSLMGGFCVFASLAYWRDPTPTKRKYVRGEGKVSCRAALRVLHPISSQASHYRSARVTTADGHC